MAQSVTITIQDDAKAVLLLDAFCIRYGYRDTIDNPAFDDEQPVDPETNPLTIANPETKKQFLKRWTIRWWREVAVAGSQKTSLIQANLDFDEANIIID